MSRSRPVLLCALAIALMPVPAVLAADETPGASDPEQEVVVLLHGLGRSAGSMALLEQRLESAGYRVHNIDYPSRQAPPDALVALIAESVTACCADSPRVHYVTHSLGGILARAYLAAEAPANAGRLVMLAPPNRGSELPDLLGDQWLFEFIMGPTASELGTDPASFPNRLPMPPVPTGVIAGTGSINPVGTLVIPGEDDGMVSVCRTWIEGLADFLVVPQTHAFIMRSTRVTDQVIRFLRVGAFDHEDDDLTARYVEQCLAAEQAAGIGDAGRDP
ncbi:MAG: alpha/beta fold hydrolase [Gammaproteobacteria bacterium]|jgi:pimeloyl-ACP methyl ester carboxylesterase